MKDRVVEKRRVIRRRVVYFFFARAQKVSFFPLARIFLASLFLSS